MSSKVLCDVLHVCMCESTPWHLCITYYCEYSYSFPSICTYLFKGTMQLRICLKSIHLHLRSLTYVHQLSITKYATPFGLKLPPSRMKKSWCVLRQQLRNINYCSTWMQWKLPSGLDTKLSFWSALSVHPYIFSIFFFVVYLYLYLYLLCNF